ncbi:MAG: hypothetical protein IJM59_03215 [Proteobacteria bacterium]|nr:hypothetical protein [Pseudomonadota bacterium]
MAASPDSADNSDNRKKRRSYKLIVLGILVIAGTFAAMEWTRQTYKEWTVIDATCEVVDFEAEYDKADLNRYHGRRNIGNFRGWVCKSRAEYEYNGKTYSVIIEDESCEYKNAKKCPLLVNSSYPWHSREPVKYWIFWLVAAGGLILVIGGILKNKRA